MSGITDIKTLLKHMQPKLDKTDFVFCTKNTKVLDEEIIKLNPIATFLEEEGMTIIVEKSKADNSNLQYEAIFNKITLEIHSSLEAVGLTAAFSAKLTEHNISANVVAGYYHDHIFVPKDRADDAVEALLELTE